MSDLKEVHDLLLSCEFELQRLATVISRALELLPPEMQDEVDPENKFRRSPYEQYLEMMRNQPGPMHGLSIKDDPNIDPMIELEKYMRWTPDDFKRNEELFIKHNFPKETDKPNE